MIEVRGAHLARGGAAALAGASLAVAPGELVALAGANGSGKSTLGRVVAGSLLVEAGTVRIDGLDPAAAADARAEVRRRVGFVPQDPADQIVAMVVGDEVAFGPRNLRLAEDEVARRVRSALARAGIPDAGERRVDELSGGELVRVAFAGALAMEPAYLVLDEVGAMLDADLRGQVRALARRLAAESGAGVLMITHDPVDLAAADRIVALEAGRTLWEGSPRALVCGQRALWESLTGGDALSRAVAAGLGAPLDPVDGCAAERSGDTAFEVRAAGRGTPSPSEDRGRAAADALAPAAARPRATADAKMPAADRARTSADAPASAPARVPAPTPASAQAPASAGGLSLTGVTYTYPGAAHPAIDDVSLSVAPGEILLLAGTSGSGKSTLAALAAGLLEPPTGTALVNGEPAHAGAVGLAAQRPEAQLFLERVDDEIAFGPRSVGLGAAEVDVRVRTAARSTGLDGELLDRHPFELSGGQQRRVGLASVAALEPGAYVFDEPTAGLDAAGRAECHRLVRDLAKAGAPVLVISHDLDEWLEDASSIALLRGGELVWHGERSAIRVDDEGPWALAGLPRPLTLGGPAEAVPADEEGARPAWLEQPAGPREPGPAPAPPPLDARVEIILFLAAVATLFATPSLPVVGLAALVLAGLWPLARRRRSASRPPLPLGALASLALVILLANLVSCDGTAPMPVVGPVGVDGPRAARSVLAIARLGILFGLAACIAATTPVPDLSQGVVRLLRPLSLAGAPVGAMGTSLSIALTSIPAVADEMRRIELAQRARGARFDEGSLASRARARAAIVVPVVLGLMRRADRLGEAMAARSFDPDVVQVPPRSLSSRDTMVLAAGLAACALALVIAATAS
ncbi:MAG: ATP-binding cassette domain-containing protein [Coriobacteriaceae bacterium]|nr:ATP-binding cassette domain-containing protein [Coriobacteriaceae bacterium]